MARLYGDAWTRPPTPGDPEFVALVRAELEDARRRALEVLRPPRRAGGNRIGTGKLPDAEIRALHARHLAGESIRELGDSVWERAGYKSPEACRSSIRVGFLARGLPVRSRSEAMVNWHRRKGEFTREEFMADLAKASRKL